MPRWEAIQSDAHPMRAYLAHAPHLSPFPGILVIMHGPGVDRFIEDRVESLAHLGYAAIAPDLFHRQPQDDGADMIGFLDAQLQPQRASTSALTSATIRSRSAA